MGGDLFAILSAAAGATSRIELGTNTTSEVVRTVSTIAISATTVDQVSGGRFLWGVGSSRPVQVDPEHGVIYKKPLTRVRATVEAVRQLTSTGQLQWKGQTIAIKNFHLWFTPYQPKVPTYTAAVFLKLTSLRGEIAVGIILTRSMLETASNARLNFDAGTSRRAAKVRISR